MAKLSILARLALVVTVITLAGCTWIKAKDVPAQTPAQATADTTGVPKDCLER